MMNKRGILTTGIVILLSLLAASCTFESVEGSGSFAYDLRGTWVSDDPSVYSGTLVITYDTITITGYTNDQGIASERPFNGYFYQGTSHDGYSEDHKIFIKKGDVWQAGIFYDYSNEQDEILEFKFGNRTEILRKQIGTESGVFASELRGTWMSDDPSVYSGTLVITDDTITITGYRENQTPTGGDDSKRPFKDKFIQGIAHDGYSQNKNVFIKKGDDLQPGISYRYFIEGADKFLEFIFGGRTELLKKQSY